jgi:hypothetical protein
MKSHDIFLISSDCFTAFLLNDSIKPTSLTSRHLGSITWNWPCFHIIRLKHVYIYLRGLWIKIKLLLSFLWNSTWVKYWHY